MLANSGSTGTAVVNGQLTSQAPGIAFTPLGYVPYAAQGAARPPSLPPSVGGYSNPGLTSQLAGTAGEPSSYSSANDNAAMVANAQENPWHPGSSPVLVVILFLGFSLFMLHFVHFRTVVSEGGKLGVGD